MPRLEDFNPPSGIEEINRMLRTADLRYEGGYFIAYNGGSPIMLPEGRPVRVLDINIGTIGIGGSPFIVDVRNLPKGHKLREGDDKKTIIEKLRRATGWKRGMD